MSAACCEESRTPSTPHLVSGSSNVDSMSTRRRGGVRKRVGFPRALEEPQAASTPQAEGGPRGCSPPPPEQCQEEALLKGLFSPPAGCMPWWRGDDLRGPQKGQRLLAVPVSITSFLECWKFLCSAEHTATRAVAEPPILPGSASSQGAHRRWMLPALLPSPPA